MGPWYRQAQGGFQNNTGSASQEWTRSPCLHGLVCQTLVKPGSPASLRTRPSLGCHLAYSYEKKWQSNEKNERKWSRVWSPVQRRVGACICQLGKRSRFVWEAHSVNQMPVQYIHFIVTHHINMLLDDRHRVIMPRSVYHTRTKRESRRILNRSGVDEAPTQDELRKGLKSIYCAIHCGCNNLTRAGRRN